MLKKIVFLDRDGVTNKDIGYLHKIGDFEFIDGIIDTLLSIQKLGYEFIIITNQSGIGRGMYSIRDFERLTKWMVTKLESFNINVLDIFYCPHAPLDNCDCRKPKTKLFIDASKKYSFAKEDSWMIGDSERDILSAVNFGIEKTILYSSSEKDCSDTRASFCVSDINDAKDIIRSN